MAPGGERPRGNAVSSGGVPVEEPLAGWRLAAVADRSKRPKSLPWQVPAEMELRWDPATTGSRDQGADQGLRRVRRVDETIEDGLRREVYERPDSRSPSGS